MHPLIEVLMNKTIFDKLWASLPVLFPKMGHKGP